MYSRAMLTPFELAYRYVVPALKRRLVEILSREYGMNQVDIARVLGISQSAVSRYLSMERGALMDVRGMGDVDEKLRRLARSIASGDASRYQVLAGLMGVALYMLRERYLCEYHTEIDDIDPKSCRICLSMFTSLVENS